MRLLRLLQDDKEAAKSSGTTNLAGGRTTKSGWGWRPSPDIPRG